MENELPYNENNVLISELDLKLLLSQYGINCTTFKDLDVFRNAFVHKSYCTRKNENFVSGNINCPNSCIPLQEESNERLEYLGDAILSACVAKYLFERYPNENEGFLTCMRSKLVNGNMLATLALAIKIDKFIIISKQIEEGEGRKNKKILEDCFESFLGAISMNFDFEHVYTWVINMFEDNVDFSELLSTNNNYKDRVLKYFQHSFNYIPKFVELKTGTKIHKVTLSHNNVVIAVGEGCNKKVAENNCSYNALIYLGALF